MAATFPKSARLLTGSAFDRVFKRARRSKDDLFTVLACPGASDEPRLGLAIGRKVDRRAAARNRIKRLIREGFRQQRGSLPPLDFVVMARPAAVRERGVILLASLARHFERLARHEREADASGARGAKAANHIS